MANYVNPTDEEIEAAMQRGRRMQEPSGESVIYAASTRTATVRVGSGVGVTFDVGLVGELADLNDEQLGLLAIGPVGDTLEIDSLDIHIYLPGLLLDLLGASGWKAAIRSELAREAGRVTSEARSRAARENGKRGGRPRKPPHTAAAQ